MNVLITGGTGFLGSAVLARLLADGHTITATARTAKSADAVAALGATPALGELTDLAWLSELIGHVDAVVHAASPNDATSVAVDAAVLDAALPALAHTGRAYLYTGGSWLFGSGAHITEDSPLAPAPMVAWRPAVLDRVLAAAADGIRTVVISPANLYGHGGGLPAVIGAGPVTDGDDAALLYPGRDQHFPHAHVDDVARLYALALTTGPAGQHLLAATASVGMNEVAATISRTRGLAGRAQPEPVDATRERLGPLTDSLLLDAQIDSARARTLGWKPSGPTLLDELSTGTYADQLKTAGGAR